MDNEKSPTFLDELFDKIKNDGPLALGRSVSFRLITKISDYNPSNIFVKILKKIALLFLHEINLFCEEKAIACPRSTGWQLIRFPYLSRGRRLPNINLMADTRHGSNNHEKMMRNLYTYTGFVQVEEGDVVVDVGAYVGGFSTAFSEKASQIIAIEPNASIDNILKYNIRSYSNIYVVAKAAWDNEEIIEINQSHFPNENSIIEVDSGDANKSYSVQADTVPNIVREYGIKKIDFLKVEAEGVEYQILEGILEDGIEVDKIVVDATPEGNSEDSRSNIITLLEKYNYRCSIDNKDYLWSEYIIFGKHSCGSRCWSG